MEGGKNTSKVVQPVVKGDKKDPLREVEARGLFLSISLPRRPPYLAGRQSSEGLFLESDMK